MIGIKAADLAPENNKSITYPRFAGQLHEDLPLSSMVGMSGGPIFDFRLNPPVSCWIVAIQSS